MAKNSFLVVKNDMIRYEKQDPNSKSQKSKRKINQRGMIIRTGDIVKVGRVPILIKEWSVDTKRWQFQQDEIK